MAQVLVVEDDHALSSAYKLILEKDGHTVQIAENGSMALKHIKTYEPDVILLDLLMPKMGGLAFLKEYDQPKRHPKTTVVILSNSGNELQVQEGIQLGAYKYIVKAQASPLQLSLLVNNLIRKNIVGKVLQKT